jgi:SAM-dependent methyltransferase
MGVAYCCPRCRAPLSDAVRCTNSACKYHSEGFPVVSGQPVLIDFDSSIVDRAEIVGRGGASVIKRRPTLHRLLDLVGGGNAKAGRIASDILHRLSGRNAKVLVVGGGTVGAGADALYDSTDIELVGTDIYASPRTQVVADGHDLPFEDGTFDAVWIQAVLEHVVQPERVVAEIHRVLAPDGLVFADTPFIQQVHEGPYDFTRFTLNGQRWLFRNFEVIEAGASSGAGSSLRWSIRHFAQALTGSRTVGRLVGLAFFWLRFFDGTSPAQEDAACGTYFYGIRRGGAVIHPRDLVTFYQDRRTRRNTSRTRPASTLPPQAVPADR